MAENTPQNLDFDTKILSKFIYALNISRQHCLAYPAGHPQIRKSAEQLISLLRQLLEFRDALTLGITRRSLQVHGSALDQRNAVYRKLANELFNLGLAGLTFRRGLEHDELLRFQELSVQRPEDLAERGGLVEVCRDLDLPHLSLTFIDYNSFSVTDEDEIGASDALLEEEKSESLWDRFVSGLIAGDLSPDGELKRSAAIDPALVAEYLSRRREGADQEEVLASYEQTITSFLQELDLEGRSQSYRTEALSKLGNFVDGLSPELRRQFLSSTFNTLGAQNELAEEVLTHLSSDALFTALEDVNEKRLTIPPTIMNLLGKLSQHASKETEQVGETISSAELGEHLRSLFREDDPDRFIPGTYQHLLHSIVSMDDIPTLEGRAVEELRAEISTEPVDNQVCNVVIDLLGNEDGNEQDREELRQILLDLLRYFLETGQFDYLVGLQKSPNRSAKRNGSTDLTKLLADNSFLEEILAAMSIWGKDKFPAITELIRKIGAPFIEPLINRMAIEKRMSLRRYYLDRLEEMGDAIREPVMLHLRDSRWYVVRNLVALLRRLNDPVTLHGIRSLINHPHPKVRIEVFKTLRQFNDPQANQYLARELDSGDRRRQWQAMRQLDGSFNPELFESLLRLLEIKDQSADGFALKTAAVDALEPFGNPAALPALERVLQTRSLLHGGRWLRLKKHIILSLSSYPAKEVGEILELLVAGGGDLGEQADALLKTLKRRRS